MSSFFSNIGNVQQFCFSIFQQDFVVIIFISITYLSIVCIIKLIKIYTINIAKYLSHTLENEEKNMKKQDTIMIYLYL